MLKGFPCRLRWNVNRQSGFTPSEEKKNKTKKNKEQFKNKKENGCCLCLSHHQGKSDRTLQRGRPDFITPEPPPAASPLRFEICGSLKSFWNGPVQNKYEFLFSLKSLFCVEVSTLLDVCGRSGVNKDRGEEKWRTLLQSLIMGRHSSCLSVPHRDA